MRAKSALGGKVPSPPATPAPSTDSSEANAPVAVDAPKYGYLKYSLPPLRPNLVDSVRKGSKAPGKGKDSSWGEQNNNRGDGWDNSETNNAKNNGWSWDHTETSNKKSDSWDGGKSPRQLAKPSASSSRNSRKGSSPGFDRNAGAKSDAEKYPRPQSPPGWDSQNKTASTQNDDAGDNWDKAGDTTGNW